MLELVLPDNCPKEVEAVRWQQLLTAWSKQAGKDFTHGIVVSFVTAAQIQELNRQHANKSEPTDVLSFTYDPPLQDDSGGTIGGEIVICPEVASEFADRHQLQLTDEYATLFVHGLLHLAGWDHVTEEDRRRYESTTRAIIKSGGYQTVSLWLD